MHITADAGRAGPGHRARARLHGLGRAAPHVPPGGAAVRPARRRRRDGRLPRPRPVRRAAPPRATSRCWTWTPRSAGPGTPATGGWPRSASRWAAPWCCGTRRLAEPTGLPPVEPVDAVVAVSAPSRWFIRDTVPMRRVHWLLETPTGRWFAEKALRTRIGGGWGVPPEWPVVVVGRIAPTPLLIVQGDRDPYFGVEHGRALAAAAAGRRVLGAGRVRARRGRADAGAGGPDRRLGGRRRRVGLARCGREPTRGAEGSPRPRRAAAGPARRRGPRAAPDVRCVRRPAPRAERLPPVGPAAALARPGARRGGG